VTLLLRTAGCIYIQMASMLN